MPRTQQREDAKVLEWLKRAATVHDVAVLVASLRADLVELGAEAIGPCFEAVADGADAGLRDHEQLLLALGIAAEDDALVHLKKEAGVLAELSGFFGARDLLIREQPAKPEDDKAPIPIAQMLGRPVSLGERKSLARGSARPVLDRVLRDPSPDVVRLLLANPAITETDVVRLVARRPGVPEVLREVFVSLRWCMRIAVRTALVKNPRTPTDLALTALRVIPRTELDEVSTIAELPLVVRDAARRLSTRIALH